MDSPVEVDRRGNGSHSYSAAARSVLGLIALGVTLLPIPVIYFKLMPAYQTHAWFLVFYTPFLCLLTLCYLFYVRDSLARTIFADLLDPPPPPDPYYREPLGDRLGRGFRRVKKMFVGFLPVLLVLVSMYCVKRYFTAFENSLSLSAETYIERVASRDTVQPAAGRSPDRRRSVKPARPQESASPRDTAQDSVPLPSDTSAVRKYVLRTAEIDDIPQLTELSVLYAGAFVALLIAVTLMALKEYAKEALGLSEHELMFGRYRRSVAEE